jgi:bacterioferritin
VMALSGPIQTITDPQAVLARAAEMEQDAIGTYNHFVQQCAENADATTKQVFEASVTDEERHLDEFGRQLDNIKRFGPSYLALQSFGKAFSATAE